MQSKIPPITSPKESKRFSSPRCAMEDSYRQPLMLEPGNCQEGKYEEEKRKKRKGRRIERRRDFYTRIRSANIYPKDVHVCIGHMTGLSL